MKNFILLLMITLQISLIAQADYSMKLVNPNQLSEYLFEFDITIQSVDSTFSLTSYQCSFSHDLFVNSNDTVKFSYIENSSDLMNYPLSFYGLDTIDGTKKFMFVSGIGNDLIDSEEKSVGKFRIESTMEFLAEELNLKWNFVGTSNTILTGDNFENITDSTNHHNFDYAVTDIEETEEIPTNFELMQNYPNPFNPVTTIKYSIPTGSANFHTVLKIYDILGREVKTLVNEIQSPGNYEIAFNGSNLASGTYFYELSGKNFRSVKKLILLK